MWRHYCTDQRQSERTGDEVCYQRLPFLTDYSDSETDGLVDLFTKQQHEQSHDFVLGYILRTDALAIVRTVHKKVSVNKLLH